MPLPESVSVAAVAELVTMFFKVALVLIPGTELSPAISWLRPPRSNTPRLALADWPRLTTVPVGRRLSPVVNLTVPLLMNVSPE